MKEDLKKNTLLEKLFIAVRGAGISYKTEVSIRIQTSLLVAAMILGFYLHISPPEWLWIVGAGGLLLITETLNTAIEKLVDLVSPGYNETAGLVKDIAAGAVFMSAAIALIVALIIFIPYL
jgi:diacylglycerol kinase